MKDGSLPSVSQFDIEDEEVLRRARMLEEGVKRISQESIENIRSDGNVFNINVDEKSSGAKSHLPGSPQEPKYSQPKQVSVIFIFINSVIFIFIFLNKVIFISPTLASIRSTFRFRCN